MHWNYKQQPEQNPERVMSGQGKEYRWESDRRIKVTKTYVGVKLQRCCGMPYQVWICPRWLRDDLEER